MHFSSIFALTFSVTAVSATAFPKAHETRDTPNFPNFPNFPDWSKWFQFANPPSASKAPNTANVPNNANTPNNLSTPATPNTPAISNTQKTSINDACKPYCQFPASLNCPVRGGVHITRDDLIQAVKSADRSGKPVEESAANTSSGHCSTLHGVPYWTVSLLRTIDDTQLSFAC
jgi:hypothetical protein